jgi:hypothetical protein
MRENPYAEQENPNGYSIEASVPFDASIPDGYVKNIQWVGIASICQAVLEMGMSLILGAVSFSIAFSINSPQMQKLREGKDLSPETLMVILIAISIGAGVIAILRLISGVMLLYKRGRVFALVVSIVGLAMLCTCYCAPSSLGVAIYALVVLIQPTVIHQFQQARG